MKKKARGRPAKFDNYRVKLPLTQIARIRRLAQANNMTHSQVVIRAVDLLEDSCED